MPAHCIGDAIAHFYPLIKHIQWGNFYVQEGCIDDSHSGWLSWSESSGGISRPKSASSTQSTVALLRPSRSWEVILHTMWNWNFRPNVRSYPTFHTSCSTMFLSLQRTPSIISQETPTSWPTSCQNGCADTEIIHNKWGACEMQSHIYRRTLHQSQEIMHGQHENSFSNRNGPATNGIQPTKKWTKMVSYKLLDPSGSLT